MILESQLQPDKRCHGDCEDRLHLFDAGRSECSERQWSRPSPLIHFAPMSEEQRTPEEAALIAAIARARGRALTEQEVNLAIGEARAIGEV